MDNQEKYESSEQTSKHVTVGDKIGYGAFALFFPSVCVASASRKRDFSVSFAVDTITNIPGLLMTARLLGDALGVSPPSSTSEQYAVNTLVAGSVALTLKAATLIWGLGSAFLGDNRLNKK